jgi:DNA-binding NarL/FixJ family response regulator
MDFFAALRTVTHQTKDAAMQTSSNRYCADKSRIIVIDNDAVSSNALKQILDDEGETYVMSDVVSALDWACHGSPELILLGRNIIALEGAGAVMRFQRQFPDAKILIVCDALDDVEVRQARMQGAENILLRSLGRDAVKSKVNELLATISLRRTAMA